MEIINKIVDYYDYCSKCIYRDYNETSEPCYECLTQPSNIHTNQPVCFKEGKAKTIKTRKENK